MVNLAPAVVLLMFLVVLPLFAMVLSRTRFHAVIGSAVLVLGVVLIGYAIHAHSTFAGGRDEDGGDLVVWFAALAAVLAFAYGALTLYLSRRARHAYLAYRPSSCRDNAHSRAARSGSMA